VVPANVMGHNNKNTTEEIKTEYNNYFTTDHSVSQSVIGSISVPNLTAPNNELEAEYDALMKQNHASGFSNVSYDIVGRKSLNSQSKKSGKRKDNLISTEKNDDKGFKVRYDVFLLHIYLFYKHYYSLPFIKISFFGEKNVNIVLFI
jgi:hypothetical protein